MNRFKDPKTILPQISKSFSLGQFFLAVAMSEQFLKQNTSSGKRTRENGFPILLRPWPTSNLFCFIFSPEKTSSQKQKKTPRIGSLSSCKAVQYCTFSTNWIFNVQRSISKLIFAGYKCSKNPVRNRLKIQFAKLDFSNLIFQNSNTDQQGESLGL